MTVAKDALKRLAEVLATADAVVVGGGSGLSSAAGYDHYHWLPALAEALAPFREYYGFTSPMAGYYHCYSSYGAQWGYYSQYLRFMWEAPTGQPYKDLAAILSDTPHFVLTTNVDQQFFRVFPEEKVCAFQGDFSYCQCSQPCHDAIWQNRALIDTLTAHLDGVLLPEEWVPRCSECGRVLVPWVRDDTFLEGQYWQAALERYQAFLRQWLMASSPKKVVLLELGVGEMTPSIIKLPFWRLTEKNEGVFYATLNQSATAAPLHLGTRALAVQGDLAESLALLREWMTQ